jgi:DNA-binding transcriptional MerR regulator
MPYTVKQLATLSRVSVRTLHFYDELDLLKPAYTGANGYRYYEQPQLLLLQQILFYRELGFELKRIKQILTRPGFRKTAAMRSHRKVLQQKLARTSKLIDTLDKTLIHLKGKKKMSSKELFAGFTLPAGGDRYGKQIMLNATYGESIDRKISGQDTGGALCVFEFTCLAGGPKHLHYDQDEWIYILDGQFDFHVGDKKFRAGPGECVFIPRKVPHVWRCVNDDGFSVTAGKIINAYQPAGKIEEFFSELAKFSENKTEFHMELGVKGMHTFFDKFGMDLVGPPLGWTEEMVRAVPQ